MTVTTVEIEVKSAASAFDIIHTATGTWFDTGVLLNILWEEGYTIVPREPTEEMITAGLVPTAAWQNIEGSALTVNREKMRLRYKAMIASLMGSM